MSTSDQKTPDFKKVLLTRHAENETICVSMYKRVGEKFAVNEVFCNGVDEAVKVIEQNYASSDVGAIWTNIQRLKPDTTARRKSEVEAYTNLTVDIDRRLKKVHNDGSICTHGKDAACGSWKCNATDDETVLLRQIAEKIAALLSPAFGPAVFAFSGNGFHLNWKLADIEPAEGVKIYRKLLELLKAKFESPDLNVEIDASLADATQVVTVWGTFNRKYPSTAARPQRQSQVLFFPTNQKPIKDYNLEIFLSEYKEVLAEAENTTSRGGDDNHKVNQKWLEECGVGHLIEFFKDFIAYEETPYDKHKETHHPIRPCPCHEDEEFHDHSHTRDCEIIEFPDGGIGISCFNGDLGLKSVIAKLNKLKGENYPHMVFSEPSDQEVASAFGAQSATESGELLMEDEDEEEQAPAAAPAPAPEAPPAAAPVEEEPQQNPTKKATKTSADLEKRANTLANNLIRVLLHHPEIWLDGFQHYIRRFKDKLGMNNVARKYKASSEVDEITIALPFGETLITIIKYCDAHKKLPDKDALKNFITINDKMRTSVVKPELIEYIDKLTEKPASIFEETAQQLLKTLDVLFEIKSINAALPLLTDGLDIQAFRSALRRNQNKSTVQDAMFSQGAWQEKTEEILARFERKLRGIDNSRKFKTGFHTIDNSGMNIGLDGNRAICFCGPSSNRKTTAVMSITLNFAIQGKNVLYFAGEHHHTKVLDKLTLQLTHFYKEDPEIGPIPGLSKWEGLVVTATEEDLEKLKKVLLKLKAGGIVPGYVEPQNIDVIAGGDERKIDALLDYAESTYNKYQWDCIIIDPIDSCMPSESGNGKSNMFQLKADAIQKLFNFSRHAFGGRGCMVIITAQFRSEAVRDIQRIQEKNMGVERFDDEIEAILRRDGNIHSLTTIVEKFDLCIGVATLQKNGETGIMVRGRDREGGRDWTLYFEVDPESNYMTETRKPFQKVPQEQAKAAAAAAAETMGAWDEL